MLVKCKNTPKRGSKKKEKDIIKFTKKIARSSEGRKRRSFIVFTMGFYPKLWLLHPSFFFFSILFFLCSQKICLARLLKRPFNMP